YSSGFGCLETEQQSKDGRFAAAGRTRQSDELAGIDVNTYVVKDLRPLYCIAKVDMREGDAPFKISRVRRRVRHLAFGLKNGLNSLALDDDVHQIDDGIAQSRCAADEHSQCRFEVQKNADADRLLTG